MPKLPVILRSFATGSALNSKHALTALRPLIRKKHKDTNTNSREELAKTVQGLGSKSPKLRLASWAEQPRNLLSEPHVVLFFLLVFMRSRV